eukprot:TRINITY_DN14266_c0_g1_i1.p1 TRINITY_DN14266_c0_g1~~TRINITY_DN14266_c0_g1_i1.p1  ORF type:complete len:106 (-),score=11.32 TRINITY_DN14266_c0_g1_i1:207-524(-)
MKPEQLSELHGSAYRRRCKNCRRDWFCVPEQAHVDPLYKQILYCSCPSCGSTLQTLSVGFGHEINEIDFFPAKEHSNKCDLALVLGATMCPEQGFRNFLESISSL